MGETACDYGIRRNRVVRSRTRKESPTGLPKQALRSCHAGLLPRRKRANDGGCRKVACRIDSLARQMQENRQGNCPRCLSCPALWTTHRKYSNYESACCYKEPVVGT